MAANKKSSDVFRRLIASIFMLHSIFYLHAQATSSNQGEQKVTIVGKNITLATVFKNVEKQTGLRFNFRPEQLNVNEKVTLSYKSKSLDEILTALLKPRGFIWHYIDKSIALQWQGSSTINLKPEANKNTGDTSITLTGTINAEEGYPLPGATVQVKGASLGTTTNAQGRFVLQNVKDRSIVLISYTGYQSQEFNTKGSETLILKLKRAIGALDEQVIIAYGTSSRRKLTGSISRLSSKEIEKQPVSNPLAAMIGRMSGVQITQGSGIPGGPFTVLIRGRNSISQGNTPFYIVDGVPFSGTSISVGIRTIVGGGNPLNNINPSDIESIEVLKDADATAIYGSRGANGVVLITTKKGKAGKTSLDINIYRGFATVANKLKLLTTPQYLEMRKEAFANDGILLTPNTPNTSDLKWDNARYTDWQEKLIGGTGNITDVQAVITGGSDLTQFRIGSGVHKESTVFPGNFADTKASVFFNINHKSNDKRLNLMLSGTYVDDNNKLSVADFTYAALNLPPNAPKAYNDDGTLNWENSTWTNPYAELVNEYKGTTNNLIGNANISYRILNGLHLKSSFGYTNMRMQEIKAIPISYYDPAYQITSTGTEFADNSIKTWVIEPQIDYKATFGRFKLSTLIGSTFQQSLKQGESLYGDGYTNDALIKDIRSAATVTVTNSNYYKYRYNAIFGRINLDIDNKYLLNITGRRDGSSRFGPGSQFANFGAIGAAWIFSNEKFSRNNLSFLSFGKLRTSYGTTGNDQIRDYGFLDLWVSTNNSYQGVKGLYTNNLYNPKFAWEVNRKFEAALELGFLQDKILLTSGYYRNTSSNQLVGLALPAISGFTVITANIDATVRNTGWEFDLSAHIFTKRNFNWDMSLNLTLPESKLVRYKDFEKSATAPLQFAIGYPLNVSKAYNYLGVNPQSGAYEFSTASGAPSSSPSFLTDMNTVISLLPKFYGGFQSQISYFGWSFNFAFQFVDQIGQNYISGFSQAPGQIGNQPAFVMQDRWRKPGDKSTIQQFTQNTASIPYRAYSTSYNSGGNKYSNASFVRLKNISISYSLPEIVKKKIRSENIRIYFQGQNILTISNYKGLDPETQSFTSLPVLRVLTAGLQVTL